MNHFLGLVVLALTVCAVFALISKESREERLRYFLSLLGYMILGSLIAAWIMYPFPW